MAFKDAVTVDKPLGTPRYVTTPTSGLDCAEGDTLVAVVSMLGHLASTNPGSFVTRGTISPPFGDVFRVATAIATADDAAGTTSYDWYYWDPAFTESMALAALLSFDPPPRAITDWSQTSLYSSGNNDSGPANALSIAGPNDQTGAAAGPNAGSCIMLAAWAATWSSNSDPLGSDTAPPTGIDVTGDTDWTNVVSLQQEYTNLPFLYWGSDLYTRHRRMEVWVGNNGVLPGETPFEEPVYTGTYDTDNVAGRVSYSWIPLFSLNEEADPVFSDDGPTAKMLARRVDVRELPHQVRQEMVDAWREGT